MNKTLTAFVSAGLLGLALGSVQSAFAGEMEQAQEYRQGIMNVFRWNMKAMSDMMKGKRPYDAKAFAGYASDLAKAASLDLMPGFPEESDSGDTDARADIWLDFADFKQKFEDLRSASRSLDEIAAGGDKAAMGEALGKTGKACKACHDKYKD
ncbi:MAG: cytochrome c [Candidatus Thiodiazotropha sp.]